MRANQLEMKARVDKAREYIIKNGSTKGLKLDGIENDNQFSTFLKNNAESFRDLGFEKRGEK